jgi:hypothetical protein
LLGELFGVVNWVFQRFAHDPQWRLEGQLGFLAILHTWTQRLKLHFHLHCIVPGGVWQEDQHKWIPCRGKWLFRKDSLADAFRNRFLQRLRSLRKRGKLAYTDRAAYLSADAAWEAWLATLANETWIVFPKPTPDNPALALEYVARYTHKVAISDYRIKALQAGRVTYSWLDRSSSSVEDENPASRPANHIEKTDTIPAELFTRRFLSHILPDGFHKIRYFGWMAAVKRKAILAAIREAIQAPAPSKPAKESLVERILRRTGHDITLCPNCKKGRLCKTDRLIIPHRGQSP